jgi:hypothetical protein
MPDLTNVSLTIRLADFTSHGPLFDKPDSVDLQLDSTVLLAYSEINHAELGFELQLQAERIPYDKVWERGDDYPSGVEYCRILADGSVEVKAYDGTAQEIVNFADVVKAFKDGVMADFIAQKTSELTAMSWEEQEAVLLALPPVSFSDNPSCADNPAGVYSRGELC